MIASRMAATRASAASLASSNEGTSGVCNPDTVRTCSPVTTRAVVVSPFGASATNVSPGPSAAWICFSDAALGKAKLAAALALRCARSIARNNATLFSSSAARAARICLRLRRSTADRSCRCAPSTAAYAASNSSRTSESRTSLAIDARPPSVSSKAPARPLSRKKHALAASSSAMLACNRPRRAARTGCGPTRPVPAPNSSA